MENIYCEHVGFFCCSYHHSMYCPECRGETCRARTYYDLDYHYGSIDKNEKKVERILAKEAKRRERK